MKINSFTSLLISLGIVFYALFLGKSFFIPLLIAIVIWYVIFAAASGFEKIKIKGKNISHFSSMLLGGFSMAFLFIIFVSLVNANIENVIEVAPDYQEKFQELGSVLVSLAGLEQSTAVSEIMKSINVSALLKSITGAFKTVAGYTSMIIIYALFILLEYRMLNKKIRYMFKSDEACAKFTSIIEKIDQDIKTYIKIKTLASLTTATLSGIVLIIVGVDFAVFWALLIFILNYIPTVGSIIAVFFPILLSLIQFSSMIPFIVVAVSLITIQIIIGNILEPKYMGKSLNLSPLVIILSLTIWGSIWGVVGMFLCVPIMVITNIILAKFEKTRPLAVMFSARGRVD